MNGTDKLNDTARREYNYENNITAFTSVNSRKYVGYTSKNLLHFRGETNDKFHKYYLFEKVSVCNCSPFREIAIYYSHR
jgi:hypothetical protein